MKHVITLITILMLALPAASMAGHFDRDHRHGPQCDHRTDRIIRHSPALRDHHRGRHESRAHRYARKAMRQQRANLRMGCGYRGSRWHTDYRGHYDWVFRVDHGEPRRQLRIRELLLDDCRRQIRHGHHGHRRDRW